MKYINSTLFLFIFKLAVSQNNLINNPSFEDWASGTNGDVVPRRASQLENSAVWQDDHNFIFLVEQPPMLLYEL